MGLLDFVPGPLNLKGAIPAPITSALNIGDTPAPPVNMQLPSYRSQFTNKYNDPNISQQMSALHPDAQQALLNYDADRVARGQPPLTHQQTLGAIQTISTGKPATPPAERNPLNLLGNAISDIGNVVKGVPRLPSAIIHEVQDIPHIGQRISEAQAAGANPLSALLQAPGIRMIPGAYTVGNLLNGVHGIKEAVTHPVISALDVLPGAGKIAEQTAVGGRAAEIAAETMTHPRALTALATKTLDADGNLVPNRLGGALESFRDNTRVGQFAERINGVRARDVSRAVSDLTNRLRGIGQGLVEPGDPAQQAARDTVLLAEKYKFTPELAADTVSRMQADNWTDATPEQLAYHDEYKAIVGQDGQQGLGSYALSLGELGRIYNPLTGDGELVTRQQADRVAKTRTTAELANRMADRRYRVLNPSDRDLPTIEQDIRSTLANQDLKSTPKKLELRAIFHELDAQGHDTTYLRGVLNTYTKLKGADNFAALDSALTNWFGEANVNGPAARYQIPDLVTKLRGYGRGGDQQAVALADALRDKNTPRILSALRNIERRTKELPELDGDPAFASSIRSLQSRMKFDRDKMAPFTDQAAARAGRRAESAMQGATPARFAPAVEAKTLDKVRDLYTPDAATPEQAAEIARAVTERRWKALPGYTEGVTERDIAGIASDVAHTWQQMAAEGLNPTFVHRVSPNAVHQALNPSITEIPNSISSMKERVLYAAPMENNVTVALSHQAHEWMRRQTSEEFIDWFGRKYGTKEQDLREAMAPVARRYQADHPSVSMEAAFQKVMTRSHSPLDIEQAGYNWGSPRLRQLAEDQLWVPKSLADNLRSMHDPKTVLGGIFDPVTRLFRHSVVGLSIRTQVNNILGNQVQLLGEAGPGAWTHMGEALRYAKNPELMMEDPRISETVRLIAGGQKELFKELDQSQFSGKVANMAELMKGRTIGRLIQEMRQSKALTKTRDGLSTLVDKSYSLNGFFDDAHKIMGYLYGYDKAVAKGLSHEAAQSAGEALMRRALPDWGGMTPLERNLMKSIFPFYGFAGHSIRYVFRYPMEHPLRAMVVSKLAQAETEDMDTLPGSFMGSLFLGSPNSKGDTTALNLAGVNPFGSVGNSLTLAGFLSQTNPVLNSIFESVGLQNGTAELYPTLRYNADTGRLEASHSNPLMNFVGNVIPQSYIPLALLGANADFNDRLRTNPGGAYQSLMSDAGLPILWKKVNVPQEQAKAEVNREKSANAVLAQAQKSGNWTNALRYPTLRAFYDQVRAMPPEEAAKYQPRTDERQQLLSSVGNAQTGQPAPSGSIRQLGGTGGI